LGHDRQLREASYSHSGAPIEAAVCYACRMVTAASLLFPIPTCWCG